MKTQFKTLNFQSEFLFKDKGSKFIGYAKSCANELEIKDFLGDLKKIHSQATHICYAFKYGVNKEVTRANDDGEPNNSAGTPILGQITSYDLTNVCIAVVRYYGGTKLGVGGLITAYKAAAKGAIDDNEIIDKELSSSMSLQVNYEDFPYLMKLIKQNGVVLKKQIQEMNVTLELDVKNLIFEQFKQQIEHLKSIQIIQEIIQN